MKISVWPGNEQYVTQVAVHQPVGQQEIPARSQLYSLVPVGGGTVLVECLSSYINRLAQSYRVNTRILVAYEILPLLSGASSVQANPPKLSGFGRTHSMIVNGTSIVAHDWAKMLGHLTKRSDLDQLTAHPWATGLPQWGLLRNVPQWCSLCYQQWRKQERPIYQPLLWALQAVTVCVHHQTELIERCPSCQMPQLTLAAKTALGYCTQCRSWLGEESRSDEQIDDETLHWQKWVMDSVEELYHAHRLFGSLPWGKFPIGIDACVEAVGGTRQLARIAHVPNMLFSQWRNRKRTPSFTYVLGVSYVLDLSPLQLMTVEPERLIETLRAKIVFHLPPHLKPRMPRSQGDQALIQAFLQSVLRGETEPLPVRHVAHRLGVGEKYLVGRFPQECARITDQYLAHRTVRAKERVERECAEVRRITLAIRSQGAVPSVARVTARLSDPNILRRPEAKAAWRVVRYGLEAE